MNSADEPRRDAQCPAARVSSSLREIRRALFSAAVGQPRKKGAADPPDDEEIEKLIRTVVESAACHERFRAGAIGGMAHQAFFTRRSGIG